jgi:alcohol dehydrogenase (cytochrome c)
MQLNRNGFLYVIDRTNGKLLAANAFEKVNWASHVDVFKQDAPQGEEGSDHSFARRPT